MDTFKSSRKGFHRTFENANKIRIFSFPQSKKIDVLLIFCLKIKVRTTLPLDVYPGVVVQGVQALTLKQVM